jgi:hypothetical protein
MEIWRGKERGAKDWVHGPQIHGRRWCVSHMHSGAARGEHAWRQRHRGGVKQAKEDGGEAHAWRNGAECDGSDSKLQKNEKIERKILG